jgi:hypothetical protein
LVFGLSSNFATDDLESKNAFLRYLTLPIFLLLYPIHFLLEQLLIRYGGWIQVVGFLGPLLLFYKGLDQLDFRNYPLIDHQIKEGFKAIERVTTNLPTSEIDPKYLQCIVFTVSDPFHFGARYYNEFEAKNAVFSFPLELSSQNSFVLKQKLHS